MVGDTGWGAVVIAAVTPCVAAKTAAAIILAISSGCDVPGMGATGGSAGTGARIILCGVVRVDVSADPLVGVRINVLVGCVLGVPPCDGGVKRV